MGRVCHFLLSITIAKETLFGMAIANLSVNGPLVMPTNANIIANA